MILRMHFSKMVLLDEACMTFPLQWNSIGAMFFNKCRLAPVSEM